MTNSFNKRKPNQQQTTDSIAPQTYKNSINLDPQSKSGFFIFNQLDKRIKKSKLSNTFDDGRVLEILGDGQKVKYKILTQTPEINLKEEKDGYMEDYLIKARTRSDIGTKRDPEQILLNELKDGMNDIQKEAVKRKYLEAVAEHDTFAPKRPTSFFGEAPKQGDVIKIYYNNCILDSGEEIKGFYEVVNNNHDYFHKGEQAFAEMFKSLRAKYEEILKTIVPSSNDSKSPGVQSAQQDPQLQTVPESIKVGDINILPPPTVTNLQDARTPHYSVRAPLPGDTSYHSAELYLKVIKQFQVHTNPRYDARPKFNRKGQQIGNRNATFCTLFVADVTMAMGTPIPYGFRRGSKRTKNTEYGEPRKKIDSGWDYFDTDPSLYEDPQSSEEYGAEYMIAWCASPTGKKYGWVRVDAAEAQKQADLGFTTVAGGPGMGHIAMIRPSLVDANGVKQPFDPKKGPAVAEAGGSMSYNNDEGRYAVTPFGSSSRGLDYLYYFTNKSDKMQVQLTDEQKINLEQVKRELQGTQGQLAAETQAQAEPSIEEPEMSLVEEAT
jgi:hypothetical protein